MQELPVRDVKLKSQKSPYDIWLLLSALALVGVGLIAIYDASVVSAYRDFQDKYYFLKNQFIWAIVGTISLLFFSFFNYKRLINSSHYILGLCSLALILVLVPFIGREILGARRWITIADFTFQPSEFTKLGVIFYASFIISKFEKYKMRLIDTFLVYFLPIALVTSLVIIEPDLGTALIFFSVAIIMYFVGNAPIWHFILAVPTIILAIAGSLLTHPYRIERIKAFLDPKYDPQGASYQINQIIIALAAGGLFGVGLGASRSKFDFIPEVHNDAIFAVIVEETGFIGALLLFAVILFLINRCLKIVRSAPDVPGKILGIGLTGLIASQTLLNLAAVVALVPLTGIPLPFISYGGSSLFVNLTAIGILLNIKRQS